MKDIGVIEVLEELIEIYPELDRKELNSFLNASFNLMGQYTRAGYDIAGKSISTNFSFTIVKKSLARDRNEFISKNIADKFFSGIRNTNLKLKKYESRQSTEHFSKRS